jgi:hypothetical protein
MLEERRNRIVEGRNRGGEDPAIATGGIPARLEQGSDRDRGAAQRARSRPAQPGDGTAESKDEGEGLPVAWFPTLSRPKAQTSYPPRAGVRPSSPSAAAEEEGLPAHWFPRRTGRRVTFTGD